MLAWSEARAPILAALARGAPLTLAQVADAIGVTPPAALRHLRLLLDAGAVRRVDAPGATTYQLATFTSFWGSIVAQEGRALTLQAEGASPEWWRFPLLARVRDPQARASLLRLLTEAEWRGLLHPWLLLTPDERGERGDASLDGLKHSLGRREREKAPDWAVTWVVFGSHARGDAGATSDIDLLVILPYDPPRARLSLTTSLERLYRSLVDDANLGLPQRIDARLVARDAFYDDLPEALQHAIVRDGVTIFTTFPGGEFIEMPPRAEGDA